MWSYQFSLREEQYHKVNCVERVENRSLLFFVCIISSDLMIECFSEILENLYIIVLKNAFFNASQNYIPYNHSPKHSMPSGKATTFNCPRHRNFNTKQYQSQLSEIM